MPNGNRFGRRTALSMLAGGISTAYGVGSVSALSADSEGNLIDPNNFRHVYDLYRRSRESHPSVRRQIGDALSETERQALVDLILPYAVNTYISGNHRNAGTVLSTAEGDAVTRLERNRFRPDPFETWGWDRRTAIEVVRNDEKQLLSLEYSASVVDQPGVLDDQGTPDSHIHRSIRPQYRFQSAWTGSFASSRSSSTSRSLGPFVNSTSMGSVGAPPTRFSMMTSRSRARDIPT